MLPLCRIFNEHKGILSIFVEKDSNKNKGFNLFSWGIQIIESFYCAHYRSQQGNSCRSGTGPIFIPNIVETSLLRRLQEQTLPNEAPPVGKIHSFSKIAETFEPVMRFGCPAGFRIS